MPRPKTVLELVSAEWLRRNSSYSKHLSSVIPTGLHAQRALWIMQEIDGIYIPFREVEVLCHALKGQTDQLSDDELAYIVGSKLDPIALEALSQIESQMNDLAFNDTCSMSTYYRKIDKLRSEAKNIRKKSVEACLKRREGAAA